MKKYKYEYRPMLATQEGNNKYTDQFSIFVVF